MGCGCPYRFNPVNENRSDPFNSYYRKRKLSDQQAFDHRGSRRKTCKVITCIEDHQTHYCKTCGNNNSDHFSTNCGKSQSQWSPITGSSQNQYFIKLKTNTRSNFLNKTIQQHQFNQGIKNQKRENRGKTLKNQYERKHQRNEGKKQWWQKNYQQNAENRNLFSQKSIGYGGYNHNISSSKNYFQQFKIKIR